VHPANISGATIGEWRAPVLGRFLGSASSMATAACFGSLVVGGLALAIHGSPGWLIAPIVVGPVAYLWGRTAVRTWRARLTITTAEVVVAGATRTHHVPLALVDRFEPRVLHSGIGANGTPMIVLLRHGAAPVGVYALRREGFIWNFKKKLANLEGEATELNSALAQARAAAN
jgi:hypothetical protein